MTSLPTTDPAAALGGSRWNTFPEAGAALTARAFLTAIEPLLQGVIDDNALTHADREVLDAQIRATLALGTRESSLPLSIGPDSDEGARELAAQARTIGGQLATWAGAALDRLLGDRLPLPAGPLVVRSHCYGHLLTPPATDLLMGRRGGPVTMQLYNEWLHQVVLLRDALLPFTNWQDVPLLVTPTGLRHTEAARDAFLTELLVRRVRHSAVVDFARHVVTGTSGPAGYGFENAAGTALPAVLDQPPLTAPRHLLTWRPAPAHADATTATATYVPEAEDYYAAPRTLVEDLPPTGPARSPLTARTRPGPLADGARTARIEVTVDGTTTRVDLGQALRGHRYAKRVADGGNDSGAPTGSGSEAGAGSDAPRTGPVPAVLRAPGLVWTEAAEGASVDASGHPDLVVLALLGRLYPEYVTLRAAGPTEAGTAPGHLLTFTAPPGTH
ncbi:hypothetical protein [Streptomyces sp. SID11385]|uniref:hypothetical protein n=1 Tax=Streptomyces sp. SID11385 TaxID=2706031 RepID=UPI0013C98926|nr:hypothetical protein [Streptomyces sp. SID11385]NEA44508.1 hypothetical protein [Streptomyces sp. SID11385]